MITEHFTQPKELKEEEKAKLKTQDILSEFKINKLELDAQLNWDRFYKRNSDNFFKDRTWTKKDLEDILSDLDLTVILKILRILNRIRSILYFIGSRGIIQLFLRKIFLKLIKKLIN